MLCSSGLWRRTALSAPVPQFFSACYRPHRNVSTTVAHKLLLVDRSASISTGLLFCRGGRHFPREMAVAQFTSMRTPLRMGSSLTRARRAAPPRMPAAVKKTGASAAGKTKGKKAALPSKKKPVAKKTVPSKKKTATRAKPPTAKLPRSTAASKRGHAKKVKTPTNVPTTQKKAVTASRARPVKAASGQAKKKKRISPHQKQRIKYNKRVEAIARLWKEQRRPVPPISSVTPPSW